MKKSSNLLKFVEIIKKLRGPNGCPWDKEQTHQTLKDYLLEECYEVLEAIDKGDPKHLKEELGDLLLQIMLHSQIADDHKNFNIDDVAKDICEKMIRRHPHVFSNTKVENAEAVVKNWEKIKQIEKGSEKKSSASILDDIPAIFPSLFENYKISKKVAKLGFEWKKPNDVFKKVDEELREVKDAIKRKNKTHIEEELGDLLFTVANLCRVYKINPEFALNKANKKFRIRFAHMEREIKKKKLSTKKLNFAEWQKLWEISKLK